MAPKRRSVDAGLSLSDPSDQTHTKRARQSPPDEHTIDSIPNPDLQNPTTDEDSSTSPSSSSLSSDLSDAESEDADSEDVIIDVGGLRKPSMNSRPFLVGAGDLQSRLAAFLPQLKEANLALEGTGEEVNIEELDDEEGESYIEMDLGLGVLEEKGDGSEEEDDDDDEDDEDEDEGGVGDVLEGENGVAEKDVIGTLMGMRRSRGEPRGIQVVEDGDGID